MTDPLRSFDAQAYLRDQFAAMADALAENARNVWDEWKNGPAGEQQAADAEVLASTYDRWQHMGQAWHDNDFSRLHFHWNFAPTGEAEAVLDERCNPPTPPQAMRLALLESSVFGTVVWAGMKKAGASQMAQDIALAAIATVESAADLARALVPERNPVRIRPPGAKFVPPVDPHDSINELASKGAFGPPTAARTNEERRLIPHLGFQRYRRLLRKFEYEGADTSQRHVQVQNAGTRQGLAAYMSRATESLHMFFAGDFLNSELFVEHHRTFLDARPSFLEVLPDNESFRLRDADGRARQSRGGAVFTAVEYVETRKVVAAQPSIVAAVNGWHAGLRKHLRDISAAARGRNNLTPLQVQDANLVIGFYQDQWDTPAFQTDLVPAIAMTYRENHPAGWHEPPTQQDFEQALQFLIETGAFHRRLPATQTRGPRVLNCPALPMIMQSQAETFGATVNEAIYPAEADSYEATALHHIARQVRGMAQQGNEDARRVLREIELTGETALNTSFMRVVP